MVSIAAKENMDSTVAATLIVRTIFSLLEMKSTPNSMSLYTRYKLL
jgi:hypothetical protein